MEWLSSEVSAFLQVVFIDLVLAGDNAVVIGMAAAGLEADRRRRAIFIGIIAATVLRIGFASVTTLLLDVIGLLFAGGVLLLWVCWKLWRELRADALAAAQAEEALENRDIDADGRVAGAAPRKSLAQAVWHIVLADVSMSLDNVLAVAGAAREHPVILVFGLALSVVLMGAAAVIIASLLQRHRWIAYLGLGIIVYVALSMIHDGALEVYTSVNGV